MKNEGKYVATSRKISTYIIASDHLNKNQTVILRIMREYGNTYVHSIEAFDDDHNAYRGFTADLIQEALRRMNQKLSKKKVCDLLFDLHEKNCIDGAWAKVEGKRQEVYWLLGKQPAVKGHGYLGKK